MIVNRRYLDQGDVNHFVTKGGMIFELQKYTMVEIALILTRQSIDNLQKRDRNCKKLTKNCKNKRGNSRIRNSLYLDNEFVWNRSDHLGFFAEKLDGVSGSGLDVDSLDVNEGTGLLGLGNSGVVGDDSVKETLSRL